jgi:hypothetical protein
MSNNKGTCTYCGLEFQKGWCLSRHIRACVATHVASSLPADTTRNVGADDEISPNDGVGVDVALPGAEDPVTHGILPAPNLFPLPEHRHGEHYRLDAKHIEALKFLGPMCGGLPVADDKLKAMLKYARSLDSTRACLLPKTPATARRRLAKVSVVFEGAMTVQEYEMQLLRRSLCTFNVL